MILTYERLFELLNYDPDSGLFIRKTGCRGHAAGAIAGCVDRRGYVFIGIDGKLFLAHRLAFLFMTKEWPLSLVDHVDRDKGNNRWVNLRSANKSQNNANSKVQNNNTSGFKGVSWCSTTHRWQAFISIDNKSKRLGRFSSAAEASAAYKNAADKYFGEFARVA